MKKSKVILLPILFIFVSLLFMNLMPKSTGSPGAKSGSPGDAGATCTACHSSTVKAKEGWITTDVPSEGYVAGEVYTITLSVAQSGITKFGFELTAEDALGNKVGIFDIGNNNEIKILSSFSSVTHTSSGTSASNGERVWSFKWTAPDEATGEVGLYAAINATNANNATSGDAIYTTELKLAEQIDNSIEQFLLEGWLKVYPNPAVDIVKVHMNGLKQQYLAYTIYNIQGKLILSNTIAINRKNSILSIDVQTLPTGNYIIHFEGDGVNLKGKFLVIGK